jgi:OOP family OmpA-OmpF porin
MFNGCPDTDGDGIEDSKDKCTTQIGTAKYEGCPVPDTDGDGLNDDYDKCPTVSGTIANNGCPEEIKKVEMQQKIDISAKTILFENGSAKLLSNSYSSLDEVTKILTDDSALSLDIEGHSDSVGDISFNTNLSQNRAETVMNYFVTKGISASRLTAKGFGSTQPVADNTTADGRKQNRRVVLKLK